MLMPVVAVHGGSTTAAVDAVPPVRPSCPSCAHCACPPSPPTAGHTTVVGTPLHLGSQPSGSVATPAMLLFGTVLKNRNCSGLRTGSGLRR